MHRKDNTNYTMTKETITLETFTDLVRDALKDHLKDCTVEVQETNKKMMSNYKVYEERVRDSYEKKFLGFEIVEPTVTPKKQDNWQN